MVLQNVEITDLDQNYYRIQKNIGSEWVNKGKIKTKEEAILEVEKMIQAEIDSQNNKFIYRVIKIEEIRLYKSTEKRPQDMLEFF